MALLKKKKKKKSGIGSRMGGGGASGSQQSPLRPRYLEQLPPCTGHCPSGNDIRGWTSIIALHEKLGLSLDEACEKAWRIELETTPHPVAFIDLYVVWFLLIVIGIAVIILKDEIGAEMASSNLFSWLKGNLSIQRFILVLNNIATFGVLLVPAVLLSFIKITVRWLYLLLAVFGGSILLAVFSNLPINFIYSI